MRKLIFYALCVTLFVSCSYEKRLARANRKIDNALKEFPQLIKKDTVFKDTVLFTKPKGISGEIELFGNSRIDSLLNLIGHDTSVNRNTINEIHKHYINYPILADTFIVDTIGIKFKLYQKGNKLLYYIHVNEDSLKHRYATEIKSVQPSVGVNLKWYEKIWEQTKNILSFIGLIFIVLIILDLIAAKMK